MIAADRDPGAPGFRHADRRALVSAEDEVGIDRLARAEWVDGIVAPGIDWPVAIAARVAERLGLPHPIGPETALLATSKLPQRERFAAAGVPQPAWEVCRSVEEARAAADRLGYPCVIKAPDRQGQRGLGLVCLASEVASAAGEALAAARGGACLVEQYADGRELTVNAFVAGGRFVPLTVTDREVARPPAFGVALAHVWPSALPDGAVAAAVEASAAAARALGVVDGPTYTQVLAADGGPRVVELAARLGGGHDAELCHAALGIDLNGAALAAALGEHVEPSDLESRRPAGGACVRFLVAPQGTLAGVEGVERARAAAGVRNVELYRQSGWTFGPLRRGADRAGAILVVGESREQAVERAAAAAGLLRFQTEPADVRA